MAISITSLTGNGLRDWLIQRVTAVILAVYVGYLLVFMVRNSPLDYVMWLTLFDSVCWKIFTVIALLAVLLHTWIGLWTVMTDYLKNIYVRLTAQISIFILLLGYFIWGLLIVWGK